ncbi:MAG TPA: CoA transferase, partial [Spongiibacteraceae bacterium]
MSVFADLRVLDLSWGVAGPMATMLLADAGADVIKVEPEGGDPFRFQLGYKVWQRGKRSIILNLKDEADRDVFLQLIADADVLVESFAPGTTAKLGIDYDTLSALNPGLIYASVTAYGNDAVDADRKGYDALVAARCGVHWEQRGWPEGQLNHMAGIPDPFPDLEIPYDWIQGPPRPGPVFASTPSSSLGAFYNLSTALHAAIVVRGRTGLGQKIDTTLVQGAMNSLSGSWQRAEKVDAPMFNTWVYGGKSPKGHFKTSDGRWIHNWVPNPRFILQASAGDSINSSPDLSVQNDPDRFGMGPEELLVMSHYQEMLAAGVAKFTADEWVEAAATAGMTLQEVRSPEAALNDPAFLEEGCTVELDDPELGRIRALGVVIELDKTPAAVKGPAPLPGQHSDEIRNELKNSRRAQFVPVAKNNAKNNSEPPLKGVRVLDLGLAVAGPFGAQVLSDLGAEVIKINAPYDYYWHRTHISMVCNRGKRSIAVDLKSPQGMQIFHELVRSADVVQHNMRYDAAERLGVDFESLKAINPKIIYCHTRGFDRSRMFLPGNDQTGACLAGNQYEDGAIANGGKPLWPFTSFGDVGNGFLSAFGIMQALYHRDRTGEAQFVGTSIINAQLLNCSFVAAKPNGEGFERPRLDRMQERLTATYGLYEAADGWLCVAAITDDDWAGLAELFPSKLSDPRFATRAGRAANDAELGNIFTAEFKKRTLAEWSAIFDKEKIAAEVTNPDFGKHLHDDPEMVKRGWVVAFDHPEVGRLDQIGDGFTLSKTPGVIQGRPLIVGEATRAILAELGYSEDEIDALKEQNV